MRQFKHLSSTTIRSIYVGYLGGEPKLAIARRLEIDNSTVHYHINKIKHLPQQQVVALIRPECGTCSQGHTSFKCLVCGKGHDNIKNEEFQLIRQQRAEIAELKKRLSRYEDIDTIDRSCLIVPVRG